MSEHYGGDTDLQPLLVSIHTESDVVKVEVELFVESEPLVEC